MKTRNRFQIMIELAGLVKPLMGYMVLAIIMGLLGHLCAAFITIFGGYAVLDRLGIETPFSLGFFLLGIAVSALMRGVLRYAEQACNHFIAFKLLALIRDKVFRALRKLCPAKLDGKDKGDLISVITSDIELLEVFYAHTISPAGIAFFFMIIMSIFIGSFRWSLAVLAILAYLTVGVLIPFAISRSSGDDGMKFRTRSGELSSFMLDSLRGLWEILQYGQGKRRLEVMGQKMEGLAKDEERMKRTLGRNIAVTNTVILFYDLSMLFFCAWLYQAGKLSFMGALIPTLALMSSFGPFVALADLGSTLQKTFGAGERVLDILEEIPAVEDITGKEEVAFAGASAEHVTFSYGQAEKDKSERILSDVTVDLPRQKIVGIVGRSGSGKSTLLKLFMRFWEAQEGKVMIADTAVGQINTSDLRDMESFMTQETHLFHDSIRNNLKIAKQDATEEEIVLACKKASVHDLIMSFPKGYDTQVGELGDTLSGGERQRLGLARAFLHDAPFMLLDEPTSNLDSLNESVILRALGEEQEGKTVVLVSHRRSTMRIADRVYSVEHGRMS